MFRGFLGPGNSSQLTPVAGNGGTTYSLPEQPTYDFPPETQLRSDLCFEMFSFFLWRWHFVFLSFVALGFCQLVILLVVLGSATQRGHEIFSAEGSGNSGGLHSSTSCISPGSVDHPETWCAQAVALQASIELPCGCLTSQIVDRLWSFVGIQLQYWWQVEDGGGVTRVCWGLFSWFPHFPIVFDLPLTTVPEELRGAQTPKAKEQFQRQFDSARKTRKGTASESAAAFVAAFKTLSRGSLKPNEFGMGLFKGDINFIFPLY